ncbi:MAG: trypsin-like peptidase domain-containing protein [Kofleriaceae bacterium]
MHYPAVVRVFATAQEPDYDSPWQARAPSSSTGSGVVVGPTLIVTGAHVVAHATFLQIQKQTNPDKAIVRVRAISHDCDLALLEVVEPVGFLADVPPASIGDMPALRDPVAVVGFPVGGEEVSITEGVVSRIEVQRYSHSQRHLLAVTIDAAINAGNSGGPVFGGEHVIGIAFQKLENVDNIGEMVPPPLLRWFLDGALRDAPLDVPALGVSTQNLENPRLRADLGLPAGDSGVVVVQVDHGGSAHGLIQPRDVIVAIDGVPIASNGTVVYLGRHRTRLDVVLGGRFVGDRLPVTVRRAGELRELALPLAPWRPLVPRARYERDPVYFVYGGLVFQVLSRDFLATWSDWWNKAPKEFLYYYYMGQRSAALAEVVILTQVLADDVNLGYGHLANEAIVKVDGVVPRDMVDLVERIGVARAPSSSNLDRQPHAPRRGAGGAAPADPRSLQDPPRSLAGAARASLTRASRRTQHGEVVTHRNEQRRTPAEERCPDRTSRPGSSRPRRRRRRTATGSVGSRQSGCRCRRRTARRRRDRRRGRRAPRRRRS